MLVIVHCWCYTAIWLVSWSNLKSTENVFLCTTNSVEQLALVDWSASQLLLCCLCGDYKEFPLVYQPIWLCTSLPYLVWIPLPWLFYLLSMHLISGVLFIFIFWSSPSVWELSYSLHTVWWSCVVLLLCGPLSMLMIPLVADGCFSN